MKPNIVITGANRGIGLSFCKYYHSLGYHVFAVCRTKSEELGACANHIISGIDIASSSNCQKLIHALSGSRIDLLINNAGLLLDNRLGSIQYDTIEMQFQVNALGALRITEGLIPNLRTNAKVALISSRMGSIDDNSSGGRYGYRMSKAALNAAGKSLAIDLKPKKIAVGIYHPGLVSTDMIGGIGDISSDEAARQIGRAHV